VQVIVILAMSLVLTACGAATNSQTTTSGSGDEAPAEEPVRLLDEAEAARAQTQAMQAHVRARELHAECDADANADACHQAEDHFSLAADTWRALIDGRPGDTSHPEWRFMLAQASLHSGAYDAAAAAAEQYLRSGDTQWRTQAAGALVGAREHAFDGEMHSMRQEPPEPDGQPPAVEPLDVPEAVQQLFDARTQYVEVVPEAEDPEHLARRYAVDNAVLLHRYGHWERAQPALRTAFTMGCSGDAAWEGGQEAWRALRDEALALERYDAVQTLGEELVTLSCDFGEAARPTCGSESTHPQCLASLDRVSGQLHRGGRFMQRAEHARGEERRRWAGRAGAAFLEAIEPGNDLDRVARITALVKAGRAYRMAEDRPAATAVDLRIVDEVDSAGLGSADRSFAIVTVASALSRQLAGAMAAAEREAAVQLAQRLLREEYDLPELSEERQRAQRALPELLAALGRHAESARALTALAQATTDPQLRRRAELDAALARAAGGSCRPSLRPLRTFVNAHRADVEARDTVVEALWQVAECESGRRRVAALEEIVAAAESGGAMRAETRSRVASATFELVDADIDAFARTRIRLPRTPSVEEMVDALQGQLEAPSERAQELVEAYEHVSDVGDAEWTAAAHFESARVLLALEQIVREASWQIPSDLQRQQRELNAAAFTQLRGIVESRVGQIIEAQAAPIRCRAGTWLTRGIRIAQRQNVDSERIRAARTQLRDERWPTCTLGR